MHPPHHPAHKTLLPPTCGSNYKTTVLQYYTTMYEPIRQLIRENRLRKAMHDMNQLDMSREHVSRLVTLDRRLRIIENKQIENLSEERLLTIEENGLVKDMLVFLNQVEFPQQSHQSGPADLRGAAAGAKEVSKKSSGKWIGLTVATIALLTIGFFLWPENNPSPAKAQPTSELRVPPGGDTPNKGLTDEERKKLALQEEEAKKQEELRQQEAIKERERRIAEAKKRRLAEEEDNTNTGTSTAFMTSGDQVDMAITVYSGQGNLTKEDLFLSKSLSSFLGRAVKEKTNSIDVLTSAFHNAKERDLMFFGRAQADPRLSPRRARYLVLADVRNVDNEGKAQLRMCIFDTASGKSILRKETAAVGTASQMQEKYILYAVRAFITEKLNL